jgi:putative copper export protein
MMILLIWLHLLAAISWIGGMIFLSLVLAPLVRQRKAAPEFLALFRSAALKFRVVVWVAVAVLVSTGPLLLQQRGVSVIDPSQWPWALRIKIGFVVGLLALTVAHDLILGPRMRTISAIPEADRSPSEQVLLRTSSWLPRLALVLALCVVLAAAMLARS